MTAARAEARTDQAPAIHVYDRPRQPATHWVDHVDGRAVHHRNAPRRLLRTFCCGLRRQARGCEVKAFYDGVYVFCRAGHGCAVPKRRAKAHRVLAREFKAGLSMVGLARKYGMTQVEVERSIRRRLRTVRAERR